MKGGKVGGKVEGRMAGPCWAASLAAAMHHPRLHCMHRPAGCPHPQAAGARCLHHVGLSLRSFVVLRAEDT